jgi:acid phosphatase
VPLLTPGGTPPPGTGNLIGGGVILAGGQAPPPPPPPTPGASGAEDSLAITAAAAAFASPPSSPGSSGATAALTLTATATGTGAGVPLTGIPAYDHIVMVIEENHGYTQIIGSANAPYINSILPGAALFTDSHGGPTVLHPSFPNYMQLFSGATQGVTNDNCPPAGQPYQAANMASSLIAAGKTFAGYAESWPGVLSACGPSPYAGRHVPWVWFANVPASSAHNFTAFPASAAGFTALPTLAVVVPDLSHDMHSFGTETDAQTIQMGDAWLKTHLDGYLTWAKSNNSLLIIQFDEDNFTTADRIPTIFAGAHVKPGQYSEHITHYNILATIEKAYGAALSGGAATATPITDCWI